MLFTTDRQTLDDLNIFGKHGSDSVYSIFNRTFTRGGAVLLEEVFQYPLSDEKAINQRRGIIQSFAQAGLSFPFATGLFDAIESYLANTDERTRLTGTEHSLGKKLSNLVATDAQTVAIHKGIQALVELLKAIRGFIGSPEILSSSFYRQEREEIISLLSEPAFAAIAEGTIKGKLPSATLVAYDALFRFRERDRLQKLLRHVYYLDVYLSVAKVAQERKFVFAEALPRGRHLLKLKSVYHPHVKKAIPNSIDITPERNVLFLTGANMAGKSTFMKALGIALFLAHMGFPVPAEEMSFSVLDGIYTTINLPDNLGMGASHFYAEVLRVKKMAHELSRDKSLFVVFDELFRGTNVKDAYEATIAITKAFARKRNSLFVISTHIIEAGEVLKEACANVHFVYLPTLMDGNKPIYTYQLSEGITDDRHGMVIIRNEKILEVLEEGAKS